jgi:hypothetical protein
VADFGLIVRWYSDVPPGRRPSPAKAKIEDEFEFEDDYD